MRSWRLYRDEHLCNTWKLWWTCFCLVGSRWLYRTLYCRCSQCIWQLWRHLRGLDSQNWILRRRGEWDGTIDHWCPQPIPIMMLLFCFVLFCSYSTGYLKSCDKLWWNKNHVYNYLCFPRELCLWCCRPIFYWRDTYHHLFSPPMLVRNNEQIYSEFDKWTVLDPVLLAQ